MATIYEVLQREHSEVRKLLEELHDTDTLEAKRRATVIARVVERVAAHSRAEQEVVYPLLSAQQDLPAMQHALEEHVGIETALRDLVACDVHDELWMAKLEVLRESFDQHVDHEEGELFVLLRKALDVAGAERLADEFGRRKSVLTGHAA